MPPLLTLHGGGAKLEGTSADGLLQLKVPALIRDLDLDNVNGSALTLLATTTGEHLNLTSGSTSSTVYVGGNVTLRDIVVHSSGCGIALAGGSLTLDIATVSGGSSATCGVSPTVVDIKNLLVFGTTDVGLDFTGTTGTVAFTTVANTARTRSTVAGIACTQSDLNVVNSVIWTSAGVQHPAVSSFCTVASSIVGPVGIVGAVNSDPLFVNVPTNDYHLSGGSPARDVANAGPARDFEGDSRPQGPRYDYGADEAP